MKSLPLLYHVSPKQYDVPDIDKCLNFLLTEGEAINKSPNGAMGLWVSPFPGICAAFGSECATLQLQSNARLMGMSIRHLYTLYGTLVGSDEFGLPYDQQVLAHWRYGRKLAEIADVLCIVDRYNHFGEVIVLNVDVIVDWHWENNFNFTSAPSVSTSLEDFDVEPVPKWFFDQYGNIIKDVDFPLEEY